MATARISSENGTAFVMPPRRSSVDVGERRFKRTGKRDEIFLATKFVFIPKVPGEPLKGMDLNGTPEYVAQAIDNSLKRLGVEQIDLWYAHR